MFGSATTNTGFGGFGTANTTTTNTTTPSLFGSAPPTTTTPSLFGSAPATTTPSLFGSAPATTTPSLFGSAPPTTTPSLFGNATSNAPTTTTPSLFGSAAPTTTPSLFGSAAPTTTPSLFGSAAPTTTPSLFGSVSTTTTTPLLFGSSGTSAPPAAGNSLFGSQPANSLFNTSQAPAAGAATTTAPEKGYLDLDTCFPDTKVPHFVVTPEGLTRSMVPANFFHGATARDTSVITSDAKTREPLLSSVGFSESSKALPFYLTSSQNNNSTTSNKSPIPNFNSKKRVLEGSHLDIGRNVMAKNEQGVFTQKDNITTGFDKHFNGVGGVEPPRESLNDTGIQTGGQEAAYQSNEMANPFGLFNASVVDNTKTRIRVFGYDGKDVDKIIRYFTNLGELSEPCKSQGNWITFNYVSPETALKAIECNGMNIDQNHLVGVTWDEGAKKVENLHYTTQDDLYKKSSSFLNIFHQQRSEQKFVDKIREKFLSW